ncbi:AN1-like zinc finger protein [Xylaria bambusicola]|uniref:AN1-like zinc finger protein n=1 Tax=Xylaria bambusicola TaxID=326684 RepID=UPI002007F7C9|nr:AN1-like zinc finger protein [Xylaria bambusicola]KAI0515305.1 AN1-like zinc finger protein [Xylaria bambusicola]
MSSSLIADAPDTSYVKMDKDNDATLIGKHCQLEYCNQLDFLPFFCQSCKKTFCLDHRTEDSHKCENKGAWAERRRQAQLARPAAGEGKRMRDFVNQKPCAAADCKTTVGTSLVPGVHCANCNHDYCLKHRLREEHDCKNKVPIGARSRDVTEQTKSAFAKLRAWGNAKREQASRALPKPKPTSASARLVAVNNLKRTAKGDAKLPPEKRVYLYVEAEAETTTAKNYKGEFFYSKDWVIGRILDAAAKSLQVENINNQSSDERDKLRVFHVEGGRVLEFNEKVGSVLASGNTIVLLRGIGPPPDLIEM